MAVAQETNGAKIPFRYGSRKRLQPIGILPYRAGETVSLELPRVGFLAGLLLTFRGSVTGATSASPRAPYTLINRIRVGLNLGSATIYDVTGWGTYVLGVTNGMYYPLYQNLNSTPTTISFGLYVPISVNLGDAFSTGLILLQDPQVRATLEILWDQPAAAYPGATAGQGNLEVHYVYFEVPPLNRVSAPPLVLHRVLEENQAITNTGDNVYVIPRQGTLLQLIHLLELNGQPSREWNRYRLILNRVDTILDISQDALFLLDLTAIRNPSFNYPEEVIPIDLFRAMGATNMGDLRDALDTEAITTMESVVTIAPGATLGANNNLLRSIRRFVQPIRV